MTRESLVAYGCLAIIGLVLGLYFWMRIAAPRALSRIYAEIRAIRPTSSRLVEVRFHTYWGLLAFFVQQEHRATLPADIAEIFLRRLHSFNVRWGMFAAGALFIPLISWGNLRRQLRIVRDVLAQEESAIAAGRR
jgi:hypothetical protein